MGRNCELQISTIRNTVMATMTGQDIVNEARIKLDDTDATSYRWSDAAMLTYVDAAENFLTGIRPETLLRTDGAIRTRATLTSLATELVLSSNYKEAFVSYVVQKALSVKASNRQDLSRGRTELDTLKLELGMG